MTRKITTRILENAFFHSTNLRWFLSRRPKTFLIDLPIVILFGVIFSFFENPSTKTTLCKSKAFWHGLVLTSLFNAAALYAVFVAPDWMWMYFTDTPTLSVPALIYIFIFLYYCPYIFGFWLGKELNYYHFSAKIIVPLLLVVTEGLLIWQLFPRYAVVGTRHQFLTQTAPSLFVNEHPVYLVMNVSLIFMVISFIISFWLLKKRPK